MLEQPSLRSEVSLSQGYVARRRDFLRWLPAAGMAASTLSWTDLLQAEAQSLRKKGKACILLWMQGGPSQFETFSPLPGHQNGGATKAIETSVSGIRIASSLPETARVMDDICLIRSMTSKEGSHPRATYLLHTGYLPSASLRHPSFGSNVVHRLADMKGEIPSFVRIGGRGREGSTAGFLGVQYDPFVMQSGTRPPENTSITTDERRYQRRLELLKSMDGSLSQRGVSGETTDHSALYERASKMILSQDMKAFDISQEPAAMREAYGTSDFAAGCLLARRLVEYGVTFVEVVLGNWDTHQDNFSQCESLCGQLDRPYAQLIRDLKQRGMLENTLVIWMGEFGRTPRINGRDGRDHFPRVFNVAISGCGVRGGQVIGKTDAGGAEVTDRPVTVPDLFRSFCDRLAIDPDYEHMSPVGRPLAIVDGGQVIKELT